MVLGAACWILQKYLSKGLDSVASPVRVPARAKKTLFLFSFEQTGPEDSVQGSAPARVQGGAREAAMPQNRGGSTENCTIPTYPHQSNKFCRQENVPCHPGNKTSSRHEFAWPQRGFLPVAWVTKSRQTAHGRG